ncbi:MAG: hypothetical protein JWO12_1937 [Frankiales bacterium]|nr:hypothetical protein [Frankiales bacterium]
MLRGEQVVLRAVERDDVAQLHVWGQDHDEWPNVNDQAHLPETVDDKLSRYDDGKAWRASDDKVSFAIDALDVEGQLIGYVTLWGIDPFNRRAHLGIALGPEARGKGYGRDACRTLLRYAFEHRGLHRVQLEVLADTERAIRAYQAVGFVEDGRLRESGWVQGRFVDEIVMSVLAHEFLRG